jgi:hypothetical protein
MSRQCPADYWYEPTDADMGYGREEAEETVETVRHISYRIARKTRKIGWKVIQKGDVVKVTTGFSYTEGGPRTNYYKIETVVISANGTVCKVLPKSFGSSEQSIVARLNPAQRDAVAKLEAEIAEIRRPRTVVERESDHYAMWVATKVAAAAEASY